MKKAIINMETGEILRELEKGDKVISNKREEEDMIIKKEDLLNPTIDMIKYLYKRGKQIGIINKFGMMKVDGIWCSQLFFDLIEDSSTGHYIGKLSNLISFRGAVKKSKESVRDCSNWTELYTALEIKNKVTRAKIKKIIIDNDILRINKRVSSDKNVLVVNPNFIRKSSFTSDFAIATFKDVTLSKVDESNRFLLYLNQQIEYSDL